MTSVCVCVCLVKEISSANLIFPLFFNLSFLFLSLWPCKHAHTYTYLEVSMCVCIFFMSIWLLFGLFLNICVCVCVKMYVTGKRCCRHLFIHSSIHTFSHSFIYLLYIYYYFFFDCHRRRCCSPLSSPCILPLIFTFLFCTFTQTNLWFDELYIEWSKWFCCVCQLFYTCA